MRGDAIDLWKFNSEHPIRFSFFGETLEEVFCSIQSQGKKLVNKVIFSARPKRELKCLRALVRWHIKVPDDLCFL